MKANRIISVLLLVAVVVAGGFVLGQLMLPKAEPETGASPTASPSVTATPVPSASVAALRWPVADYSQAFMGTMPPVPVLKAIQASPGPFAGPEGNYDRISFSFEGKQAPGFTVKYVNQLFRDGSGEPVTLTGPALLQVVFNPSAAHTEAGSPTIPASLRQPTATSSKGLQSYAVLGDFEGQVSVGLGTGAKNGFKTIVANQNGLWVVSVDIARP
jgi:hypothetical protein